LHTARKEYDAESKRFISKRMIELLCSTSPTLTKRYEALYVAVTSILTFAVLSS
jgi:hypothetical protein